MDVHLSKPLNAVRVTSTTNKPKNKARQLLSSLLFLGSSSLIRLVLLTLLPGTGVSGGSPRVSQLSVSTTLDRCWQVTLANLLNLLVQAGNWESSLGVCDSILDAGDLLLAGIARLVLTGLAWEEDEASAVCLQAVNVDLEGLDRQILAAGINRNTDRWRKLAWDSGLLNFNNQNHVLVLFCVQASHTFSSAMVKPRPARTRLLYLMVGHRTTGLSLSTGRGATAATLA